MSDYGLIIKNDSGEIQIDSTYRNLSLDQSGTSESISNDNTSGGAYTRIAITPSPLVPIVLIRPNTDRFVCVRNYYKSGSNFTGVDIVTERSQSTGIDWQSYRENRTASGDDYGLLVYNSSGDLCFDSGKNYFRIVSITESIILDDPPVGYANGDYQDVTHTGISDPYYILTPSSYWLRGEYNPAPPRITRFALWMIGIKKLSSTSVRVGWFCFGSYGIGGDVHENAGNNPTMKLLVCNP
jgi:hypothetical protein